MRAVRIHELIGPAGLRVENVPDPSCGDGEVLIDVRAAGVNFPEVLLSYGKYQFKPSPPFIPGGEASGIVSAVGKGVTRIKVGDRVATTMINGGFAEKVVTPEVAVVKLPDAVTFEQGASTLLAYATTLYALTDRGALKEKETLLVLGAAGGIGVSAITMGKLLGARVIAAAGGKEKIEFCKRLGADETIDYSHEDLKERVKALGGANVVVDPVGGAWSEQALRSIALEGRYLVIGFTSGEIPKIPLNLVLLKSCQIVGVFWGQFVMRDPDRHREHVKRIFDWVAEGKLSPPIDVVAKFEQAREVLERMESRRIMGKAVLVP
jgi:NADPH:quinone reductase